MENENTFSLNDILLEFKIQMLNFYLEFIKLLFYWNYHFICIIFLFT